jgi:hypothetical protein
LGFLFLLGISDTLLCSMTAPHVKIVPLLDVHQLLMLFEGTLTYSEPRTFSLTIFYNSYNYYYYYYYYYCYIYVSMYEYYPLSPHSSITIANVFILLFSPVNDKFDLSWNYYYYYYYYYYYILPYFIFCF